MLAHTARRTQTSNGRLHFRERPAPTVALSALISQWLEDGVITSEQAARMTPATDLRVGATQDVPPRGSAVSSVVIEALGYLGGVIILAASMLISAQYWDELSTLGRLLLLGGASAVLLAAGAAAPGRLAEVGDRLRAVLWLASVAAGSGFLAVLAVETFDLHGADVAVLIAAGTAAYAVGLWLAHDNVVQQLAMMVALAMTGASVVANLDISDDLPGIGAWSVGLVWALLAWGGQLRPRRVGIALGSVTMIVGAMMTGGSDAGTVLTLVTVSAVVAAAILMRDLLLLGVGTIGVLINLPTAVSRWFPDTMVVPYVLLAVGVALVLVAVRIARRRTPEGGAEPHHDYSVGQPRTAVVAAVVVVTVTVAVVAAIGLV